MCFRFFRIHLCKQPLVCDSPPSPANPLSLYRYPSRAAARITMEDKWTRGRPKRKLMATGDMPIFSRIDDQIPVLDGERQAAERRRFLTSLFTLTFTKSYTSDFLTNPLSFGDGISLSAAGGMRLYPRFISHGAVIIDTSIFWPQVIFSNHSRSSWISTLPVKNLIGFPATVCCVWRTVHHPSPVGSMLYRRSHPA